LAFCLLGDKRFAGEEVEDEDEYGGRSLGYHGSHDDEGSVSFGGRRWVLASAMQSCMVFILHADILSLAFVFNSLLDNLPPG
jgi:hypothetical protein